MPDSSAIDKPLICIVDPDTAHATRISNLLARRTFLVRQFQSAEALLATPESLPTIDGVISELRLPGINGLRLFEALQERHPGLAYIILTSEPELSTAVDALRLNVSDYMVKPAVERDLLNRVHEALAVTRRARASGDPGTGLRTRAAPKA